MQAKILQNGEVTIVDISGNISYETIDPFRNSCLNNLSGSKLIFNLQNLSFVGSTGITQFVQTLGDLASNNPEGLKLCRVSSEFRKVIDSNEMPGIEIFEEPHHAMQSFFRSEVLPPQT